MLANMNVNFQKFWRKRSVTITEYDPTYKAVYLGNVLTSWAKGDGCVDKPLATLWKNYCQTAVSKPAMTMKITVCNSGLKAVMKTHGLTEYWSHRITFCGSHSNYPKVFCWVYRHEGRKLKPELRCHAVLCAKEEQAQAMARQLQDKISAALQEFKREKICRQNARLSLANCVYDNPSLPRRKILLSTGTSNYRPPLERSKSAPKLMAIEEGFEEQHGEWTQSKSLEWMVSRRSRTWTPHDSIAEVDLKDDDEDDDEDDDVDVFEQECDVIDEIINMMSTSLASEQETISDIVADDDSCSDKFVNNNNDNRDNMNNKNNSSSVECVECVETETILDLPSGGILDSITSIDGGVDLMADEGDNISDESGYSEENDKEFVCKM